MHHVVLGPLLETGKIDVDVDCPPDGRAFDIVLVAAADNVAPLESLRVDLEKKYRALPAFTGAGLRRVLMQSALRYPKSERTFHSFALCRTTALLSWHAMTQKGIKADVIDVVGRSPNIPRNVPHHFVVVGEGDPVIVQEIQAALMHRRMTGLPVALTAGFLGVEVSRA